MEQAVSQGTLVGIHIHVSMVRLVMPDSPISLCRVFAMKENHQGGLPRSGFT